MEPYPPLIDICGRFLINTQNLYGGTGNGNFLVGDLNTFGILYMSTVGCGIIYGKPKTK